MLFIGILVASALLVAASAAFFSIYGLAQVFAGAFISVVIMGVALECGKLVAASFLYRHWTTISKALKVYLVTAVFILMCITSMGISGYLTAAYQTDTVGLREASGKLTSYESELNRLVERKADMDRQISQLPSDYVAARQKLMRSFDAEYKEITPRITFLQAETEKLRGQQLATEAKVGPIVFISKAMGSETDDAIFWLVILIVCVFDPLALALTIAANIAISEHKKKKDATIPVAVTLEEPRAVAAPTADSIIKAAREKAALERNHQQA